MFAMDALAHLDMRNMQILAIHRPNIWTMHALHIPHNSMCKYARVTLAVERCRVFTPPASCLLLPDTRVSPSCADIALSFLLSLEDTITAACLNTGTVYCGHV